jgi:hypothetical protein
MTCIAHRTDIDAQNYQRVEVELNCSTIVCDQIDPQLVIDGCREFTIEHNPTFMHETINEQGSIQTQGRVKPYSAILRVHQGVLMNPRKMNIQDNVIVFKAPEGKWLMLIEHERVSFNEYFQWWRSSEPDKFDIAVQSRFYNRPQEFFGEYTFEK